MKVLIFVVWILFGGIAFAQTASNADTSSNATGQAYNAAQDSQNASANMAQNMKFADDAIAAKNAQLLEAASTASATCKKAETDVEGEDACKMDQANSELNIAATLAHAFLTKEASNPVDACNSISAYATIANTALTMYQTSCVQKINTCVSVCEQAVSADKATSATGSAAVSYSGDEKLLGKCQAFEKAIPNQSTAIMALVAANTNASSACAAYKAQVAAEKSAYCTMYPNAATCVTAATEADCASGASTSAQCACIRAGTCSTVTTTSTTGTPSASGSSGSSAASTAAAMAAQAEAEGMPLDNTNPLGVTPPKAASGLAGAQNGGGGAAGGGNLGPAVSGAKKGGAPTAKDAKAMYAGYITNNGSGSLGSSGNNGYNNAADPNKRAVFGGKLGSGTMDLAGAKPGYNPSRKPSAFTTGPDGLTGPIGNLFGKVHNQFGDQVYQGNHFIGMP